MAETFETRLQKYADLTVRVGLNLQPGQRLLVTGPFHYHGVSIQAAPLIRALTRSAYQAGARLVEVMWSDDEVHQIRFEHAPRDSFAEFPVYRADGMFKHVESGQPLLSIAAQDPDLLAAYDPELVGEVQQTAARYREPASQVIMRHGTNWCVIAAASPGWAARVFPGLAVEEGVKRLWEAIFRVCRVDQDDPVAAWQAHNEELAARTQALNGRQYHALHYHGPGTDLTVGLPQGHIWVSGAVRSTTGIVYTPNLPTEEVFTLPHREQIDGVVRATRPLVYAGTLIDDFSLRFERGRVVEARARKNEAALHRLLEIDEGARRLGEVALVPYNSPVSQSGLLFYNTLLDENAACHFAFGRAYRICLRDGESLTGEQFEAAGGNTSLIHEDFMIGSPELEVDGLFPDGSCEPVLRQGEWAFAV